MLDLEDIKPSGLRGLLRTEYDTLVGLGVFDGEKVELLRGQLVTMSPEGWLHADAGLWLFRLLVRTFADDQFDLRHQNAYAASDDSEPQPDVFVGRPQAGRRGLPSEALLLVEISDSSLRKDRTIKHGIYAENGCPEYWIIDVSKGAPVVEVYTRPAGSTYTSVQTFRDGDVLRPLHVPIEIAVADLPR